MAHMDFANINDEKATSISQALVAVENSHVTSLMLQLSDELTESGAQAIALGLQQSKIKRLLISCFRIGVLPPTRSILEVAIPLVQELSLKFGLNDDIVDALSANLVLLDDGGTTNHSLHTLELFIGPDLTMETAQRLATALSHAKLRSFVAKVDSSVSLDVRMTIYVAAMESVETLDIRDKMTDEIVTAFGDALNGNTTLQSLQFLFFESCMSRNAIMRIAEQMGGEPLMRAFRNAHVGSGLSTAAAMRLANGLSHSHLVSLKMSGTRKLSADVQEIVYEGVAQSQTIQHLRIGQSFDATQGMTHLRNALHLTSLALGQDFKNEQEISGICAALSQLTSLTDFSTTCILAFDEQPSGAGDDAVHHSDLRLQHIRAGVEQLMVAVANHPSLVRLTLVCCSDIGFAGLEMIGTHLPNIKIKDLCLHFFCDRYNPSSKDESVQRAFQRACQAVVAGVRSNWHLHVLKFPPTFFPPSVVEEIDFYLDLNKTGRYQLHGTDSEEIPMGLWCHVLAKCSDKAGLVYYYLQEQPALLLAAGICHSNVNYKTPTQNGPSVPDATKHHQ